MGQVFYRKYRSRSLAEIVGQEHITQVLSNALKQGKISHAYLFTGPRGVGKTSIARILAHEVNRLPYDDENPHLDIIEIDAASNRRIDEVRDIRDKVHTAPASAKYKVYIIDEVHMLTKEAFNALLKTLEEPPPHAIFILATTEAHKLPETIVSRTQRFSFKPVKPAAIVKHLATIAKQEKIDISSEALELIAEHGEGSFRDSISLLDQIHSSGAKVDRGAVEQMLGIAPASAIERLVQAIATGSFTQLTEELTAIRERGYHAASVSRQLIRSLREKLLGNKLEAIPAGTVITLMQKLLEVPAASDPDGLLELLLFETQLKLQPPPKGKAALRVEPQATLARPVKRSMAKGTKQLDSSTAKPKPAANPKLPNDMPSDSFQAVWDEALATIKRRHNTLYSIIKTARPEINGDVVTLRFGYSFYQKQLKEEKNRQTVTSILSTIGGRQLTIECVVDKATASALPKADTQAPDIAATDSLTAISNIFGSAELLES